MSRLGSAYQEQIVAAQEQQAVEEQQIQVAQVQTNAEEQIQEHQEEGRLQQQHQASVSRHEQLIDNNPDEDCHEYKNLDAETWPLEVSYVSQEFPKEYEPWTPPEEKPQGLLEKIRNKLSGGHSGFEGMKEIVDKQAYQRKAVYSQIQAKA